MRQTVMIVTALMIALLAVSGFIVAGSVEQMRQITEKNTLMDEMALQVKQQTERADELEAQNGDLSASLETAARERDEALMRQQELAELMAQSDAQRVQEGKDQEELRRQAEVLAGDYDALLLERDTLASDLDALTEERDTLAMELLQAQKALDDTAARSQAASARADELEDHGPDHIACSLQRFFQGDFHKGAERKYAANGDIRASHLHDLRVGFKKLEERGGKERPVNGEKHPSANGQQNSVGGGAVGFFLHALSQPAGDQRGDAYSGAHRERNKQVLQRERQRDSGQPLFAYLGYEIAVYDVVKGLYQHGEHRGQSHGENQWQNGGRAHFVLSCFLRLHTTHPIFSL